LSSYLAYNSGITTKGNYLAYAAITNAPKIVQVTTDSAISEQITDGIYTNVAIISYTNDVNLSNSAERVHLQVIVGDSMFDSTSQSTSYYATKEATSITVKGLFSGLIYKVRVRYTNASGSISGPWSETFFFANMGKDTNYGEAPALSLDLDKTSIVVKPTFVTRPSDFAAYEYRLFKDTGTEDFWDLDIVSNNIKVVRSSQDGIFDLREQPLPRISAQGVTYRVACRSVDRSNNYSEASTLGTIVVKTIQ